MNSSLFKISRLKLIIFLGVFFPLFLVSLLLIFTDIRLPELGSHFLTGIVLIGCFPLIALMFWTPSGWPQIDMWIVSEQMWKKTIGWAILLFLHLIYLYFLTCLVAFLIKKYQRIKKKSLKQAIIVFLIVSIIFTISFSFWQDRKVQLRGYCRDHRILGELAELRAPAFILYEENGNFDKFSCKDPPKEMKKSCQRIKKCLKLKALPPLKILKDAPFNSQRFCAFLKLSNYYACISDKNSSMWLSFSPEIPGYCEPDGNFVCPPEGKELEEILPIDKNGNYLGNILYWNWVKYNPINSALWKVGTIYAKDYLLEEKTIKVKPGKYKLRFVYKYGSRTGEIGKKKGEFDSDYFIIIEK